MEVHEYQTRPLDRWPRAKFTQKRKRATFKAGWGGTLSLLHKELSHLKARSVVFLMALDEKDIRLDGRPRSGASPKHPGVVISFETDDGPKQFPCDKFTEWSANVRAIALALKALRQIDSYGITQHGEQYRGWAALPDKTNGQMTKQQAVAFIAQILAATIQDVAISPETFIRAAERKTHPDAGGIAEDFKRVQQARAVLLGGSA